MEALLVMVLLLVLLWWVGSRRQDDARTPTSRPSPPPAGPAAERPAADRPDADRLEADPPGHLARDTDPETEARMRAREDAAFVEGMVVGHYVWPAERKDDDREPPRDRDPDRVEGDGDVTEDAQDEPTGTGVDADTEDVGPEVEDVYGVGVGEDPYGDGFDHVAEHEGPDDGGFDDPDGYDEEDGYDDGFDTDGGYDDGYDDDDED
jgi:hypothetical protein